jgi:hypothetical protein
VSPNRTTKNAHLIAPTGALDHKNAQRKLPDRVSMLPGCCEPEFNPVESVLSIAPAPQGQQFALEGSKYPEYSR